MHSNLQFLYAIKLYILYTLYIIYVYWYVWKKENTKNQLEVVTIRRFSVRDVANGR